MALSSRQLCSFVGSLLIIATLGPGACAQECEYESFLDALPGGFFSSTTLFKTALSVSGYKDKLPSPSSGFAITLLIPNNKAVLSLLTSNGFFFTSLGSIGDTLPSTILYNVLLGGVSPDQIMAYNGTTYGLAPSAYGLLSGKTDYNLQYYSNEDNDRRNYYFKPTVNEGLSGSSEPISVCGSWIYITDKLLVPSVDGKIKGVESVAIPENLPWSNNGAAAPVPETPAPVPEIIPIVAASGPTLAPIPAPVAQLPDCIIPGGTTTTPTTVTNPIPGVSAPSAAPATPAPGPALIYLPTPEPEPVAPPVVACNTTFAAEAKAAGLSILAGALGQPGIASQLPDPSKPATLLAPVDTAFLTMLTTLGVSIDQALSLGDRLAGVILYHVHPDEALTIDQVRTKTSLTTALGGRVGQPDTYIVGVEAAPDATRLSGLRAGNVATVTKELKVCEATVLVIDNVLLPSESLDTLPDPGPMPTTTTEPVVDPQPETPVSDGNPGVAGFDGPADPQLPTVVGDSEAPITTPAGGDTSVGTDVTTLKAGILDGGIAAGVGSFADCFIQLKAAGTTLNTTTDANGRFSFPGIPECAAATGVVTLPAGLEQLGTCMDSATGLAPPYSFTSMLSSILGNGTVSNATLPINLTPLTTLLSSVLQGDGLDTAALGQTLSTITDEVASALGFDNKESAVVGDFVEGLVSGSSDALASVVTNAQTLISNVVGGNALSGLFPDLNLDQAVGAISDAISGDPGSLLNLGDSNVVQGLLQTAFDSLSSLVGGGGVGSNTDGGLGQLLSRKMLQTDPAQDVAAVLKAVAEPIAQLNQLAKEGTATATPGAPYNASDINGLLSRCARVAQYRVAPAAGDLATGQLAVPDFSTSYSSQQIRSAVEQESVPIAATTLAPPEVSPSSSSKSASLSLGAAAITVAAMIAVL